MSGKASGQIAAAAALAVLMVGCGSSSPTSPSGNGGGSSTGPGASGATITISAGGTVSPNSVTIAVGQSVTFVNNDSRAHQIASNPHPAHTDCPNINTGLGSIAVGQTKLTDAFMSARSCGFHDHNDPTNAALQGTIRIQ
jgi:plastocyanin